MLHAALDDRVLEDLLERRIVAEKARVDEVDLWRRAELGLGSAGSVASHHRVELRQIVLQSGQRVPHPRTRASCLTWMGVPDRMMRRGVLSAANIFVVLASRDLRRWPGNRVSSEAHEPRRRLSPSSHTMSPIGGCASASSLTQVRSCACAGQRRAQASCARD
jgi:hypothetical protein